eukprot:gene6742-4835_t
MLMCGNKKMEPWCVWFASQETVQTAQHFCSGQFLQGVRRSYSAPALRGGSGTNAPPHTYSTSFFLTTKECCCAFLVIPLDGRGLSPFLCALGFLDIIFWLPFDFWSPSSLMTYRQDVIAANGKKNA